MSPRSGDRSVCLFGLGGIGAATASRLLSLPGWSITSAIDIDPRKAGRDLRSLLRLKGRSGVVISGDPAAALARSRADVVIHCTGSRLEEIAPQLEMILESGRHCVTSCEEMASPYFGDASIARRLDRLAQRRGVALLGAGVNPGFAMDALAVALSGASVGISRISLERVLDPLTRRKPFQRKVGLGLTQAEATQRIAEGTMGHVGLDHSAMLIAQGLGWDISSMDEDIEVLCAADARSRRLPLPRRPVTGLRQTLVARQGRTPRVRMEMIMQSGVDDPHDAITIQGKPPLALRMQGGIPGDQATVACLINAASRVLHPPRAGLLTVLDLPPSTVARPPANT